MKLLLEKWRKHMLTEATDLLQSKNGNIIIFSDWAKGHIERGHKEPGKGSIFADFDLSLVNNALSGINVDENQSVYTVSVPGVGYDLVLPMQEAIALPDARKVEVEKEDRGIVKVTGIVTSAPLNQFITNKLSIVVRPTSDLQYVPDDVKDKVVNSVNEGRVFSILSAWPGRGDVPPAPQWGDKCAVIIPQG